MIFVTGAGGLIGRALIETLLVRGIDAEGSARSPGASGLRHLDLQAPGEADLPGNIATAVLCAWNGGVAECASNPTATRAVNVDGNLALIDRLRRSGAKVIFLSTSLVLAGSDTGPGAALEPCCEYARQKAAVESAVDTVVRVTKVAETLRPRLGAWASELRSGSTVRAAHWLRAAPVPVREVAAGLAALAVRHQGGIFQMSALQDYSYFEMASVMAERLGLPAGVVQPDTRCSPFFQAIPSSGSLQPAAPEGCADWPKGQDLMHNLVEQAIS